MLHDPEETFCCANCGRLTKEYYRSEYNEDICIHCDSDYNYDDEGDYYEDDSGSPWNE